MRLSTSTSDIASRLGLEKTIDVLAAAGYDCIDFSQCDESIYARDLKKDYFVNLRKYAEDKGLTFNQSHAPFASSFKEEEKTKKRFTEITEALKRASYLGVENIVVHPCQHLAYAQEGNPELLFEYNMEFYSRLVPYCEEYGIRVAVENMWQRTGMINHSTCSRPAEFIRYIDELNNDCFVACLDIGHAALVREDLPDFIRALGNKRLKCLHVHDVDGTNDSHTLPYFGVVQWEKVMKALAEIGYTGDLTFEAKSFLSDVPANLCADGERFMVSVGRQLIDMFNE
jgi:sugar phosphate isomerase/epimerase